MQRGVVTAATLDERVAALGDELSPKERAVAEFFGRHREEAAFLSAAEIAQQLGTSDATVVRAVKALGYAGIPELKRELIDALRARATPASRLGPTLEDVGADPLGHAIELELALLEDARTLDRGDFDRAVDVLAGAERVLAYGLGPKGPLADYVALRLERFGRPARSLAASGLLLADRLLGARAGDALLLLAFERLDPDSDVALGRANELSLPVVLLTDTLGPKLADRVEVALPVLRGRSGPLSGSAATMAVLDALLLAVAARDRPRSLAALAELNELRKRLRGAPVEEQLR
jgi:DNA-binding MurR/RpiR family transcriptional regulator